MLEVIAWVVFGIAVLFALAPVSEQLVHYAKELREADEDRYYDKDGRAWHKTFWPWMAFFVLSMALSVLADPRLGIVVCIIFPWFFISILKVIYKKNIERGKGT